MEPNIVSPSSEPPKNNDRPGSAPSYGSAAPVGPIDLSSSSGNYQPLSPSDVPVTNTLLPKPADGTGADQDSAQPSKLTLKRNVIKLVVFGVVILLLVFLITKFVFQIYQVDGPSMQSTLHTNNKLIVDQLPKTWADITGHHYIPARGDIVIVSMNQLYSSTGQKESHIVKRVIGLPGDHLVIRNGKVTIYNKQHPKGFDPDTSMPYGKVIKTTPGNTNLVVPKDYVYVMGDNRPVSLDSRYFGPVPVKNIVGQVTARIYPLNEMSLF